MLFIKLWNYLRGYVIIKITGEYVERLLNQAAIKGIFLWDIKRIDTNILLAKVGVRDFFRLSRLTKKARCRVIILKKAGAFFMLYKLKKRKIFLAGVAFFIAAVYFLSSFIWAIDVKTSDLQLKRAVEADLRSWGLKEGTFKYNFDKKYYMDKLLQKHQEIAWVEMQVKGSRLIIELVKKKLPPELEENTPCDIIASKDGIIEEIIPLKGEAVVKPGDTVSAGDILITGKIRIGTGQSVKDENQKSEQSDMILVHAKGIVKARTWYQKAVKVPLVKEEKVPTGNVKKAIRFQVGDNAFNIRWGNIPFPMYETDIKKEIRLLPEAVGDIKFGVVEYKEINIKKEFLGVDKASREAEKQLLKQLESLHDSVKINKRKMEFTLDSDGKAVIGSLTLEVIEDIGKEQKF